MRITLPEALIPLVLRARNANRPFVTEQGAHDRIRERFLRPVQYGPPARLEGVPSRPPALRPHRVARLRCAAGRQRAP